ncbi:hypothetical protein ACJD0Z_06960 [Flavobacteriaceae bacterium M23B6Z8]
MKKFSLYIHSLLFMFFAFNLTVAKEMNTPNKETDTLTQKTDSTQFSKGLKSLSQRFTPGKATLGLEKYQPATTKEYRSFPTLDKALQEEAFHIPLGNMEPEFNADYLKINFPVNPEAGELRKKASQVLEKLEELKNFVDILTGKDLLQLPVGLRKRDPSSGNEVVIAVSEVKFHPTYSELKIFASLSIPQKNTKLFFGAEGIKFSHDGALVGDAKLVLLGDLPIAFNGDNWLLTLKGGVNMQNGQFEDKSYLSIDCAGLKEISLEGNLKVSRSVLIPLNEDGTYKCGDSKEPFALDEEGKLAPTGACYVETSFSVKAAGWNDILLDVTIPDFEIAGFKGWAFHIERAVLDLSDTRSAEGLVFPQVYQQLLTNGDQNLWRGIYAKEVSIMLPQSIERITGGEKRVKFTASNLILDSFGVSGSFSAVNLLQRGEGAAGKWGFSIDSLGITLAVNTVVGGTLAGGIKVPIMEQPLGYEGWIAENEFGLSVKLQEEYDVPVFLGKMQLKPNSSVSIKSIDGNVYPSANLTGTLTLAGALDQEAKEGEPINLLPEQYQEESAFYFKGITFEELELQTEPGQPYLKAKKFGFDGQFKLLFFPVTISNMELVTPTNTTAGLKFDLKVNLDALGANAETNMAIMGKLGEDARLHEWKFEKVDFGKIGVDFERGGVKIKGELTVMNKDPQYGDGFSGELEATIDKLNLKAGGKGMFGAKDFRYWFVDIWQEKTSGGDGNFLISSFMGGVSHRMKRTDGNSYWTPTQAVYVPNKDYGLGIRAGVTVGTKGKSSFRGKAVLELEYNNTGGLNRIGFMGEGALMTGESQEVVGANIEGFEGLKKILDRVAKFEKENPELFKKLLMYGNYTEIAKESVPIREVASSGKMGVFVGIEKDFTTDTFHGQFELYLDMKGLRGVGDYNKAGWVVLHSSPDQWYLHVGSPTDRLGLVFTIGSEEFEVGGYFMTGDLLPTQLAPHPRILEILGDDILDKNRRPNELSAGRGFAFGLSFAYRRSFQYLIFYATLEIGAGFDVMHRYYPDVRCRGRSGPVGNDGWYSMGQVYAWLYGEFGVRIKLFFIKKKVKIANAGIAALLQGQFPNPTFFKGFVGMNFSVLGGLVKGRLRLKITFGDECEFIDINPFTEVPIISDLTPINGSNDVDVFTAPQAVFNYAVGKPFSIDTEEGLQTFRINLKRFELQSEGQAISGNLEWNEAKDALTFVPDEILPPKKPVYAIVEVSFDEKVGGSFRTVLKGGQPIVEKRESTFTTDTAPDHIPMQNIEFVYPLPEQKNLYPEEYNKGYIKLIRGQSYLFDSGYTIKAQTTYQGLNAVRTNLSYDKGAKMVWFDMADLTTSSSYSLDVMAFPPGQNVVSEVVIEETTTTFDEEPGDTSWFDPGTGSQQTSNESASVTVANKKAANVTVSNAQPKSLLNYTFETSKHATFKQKARSLTITDHITDIVATDIHTIHLRLQPYENFEIPEVIGTKYTRNEPLVSGESQLRDSYYRNSVYPLNYQNYPLDGNIRVNRDENTLGVPPAKALQVPNWYAFYLQNQPQSEYVNTRYPLMYNLPFYYKADFLHLQYTIVNRYVNSNNINQEAFNRYRYLIEGVFPAMPLGNYRTFLKYQTPGGIHTDRFEIKFVND